MVFNADSGVNIVVFVLIYYATIKIVNFVLIGLLLLRKKVFIGVIKIKI
jgi:hypothetical protein